MARRELPGLVGLLCGEAGETARCLTIIACGVLIVLMFAAVASLR
jgi:hypothetical protein